MADLLARKPIDLLCAEAEEDGEQTLKRALGATNVVSLGIGAIFARVFR